MNANCPWLDEPNEDAFMTHDLQCVMLRNPFTKAWCGYAGVPELHLLHGVQFRDHVPYPDSRVSAGLRFDEVGVFNLLEVFATQHEIPEGFAPVSMVFTVHGGLSHSATHEDYPHLWFFGFNCAHDGDYSPGMHEKVQGFSVLEGFSEIYGSMGTYRTFDYVRGEVTQLASQLADYDLNEGSREALVNLLKMKRGVK